ncbi:Ig-like domain-containing protein [Photobacterium damselae]|uniref:Ig-like domain-containing protein n=1 Tax=Photobacterium damselae TaxID=38293 RepID=UPI001F29C428|nr:Ig-like domain-containing protein [Photobacterium damselae]UKA04477.1 Ig-like domain-containing protein [Photobacterium damselae subsp. damselae]
MKEKVLDLEQFKLMGDSPASIKCAGMDLVAVAKDGSEIIIKNGLSQLIAEKGSIQLDNGSSLSYKNLVDRLIDDKHNLDVLDSEFLGDVFTRMKGDAVGVAIPDGDGKGSKDFSQLDPKLIHKAQDNTAKNDQNKATEHKDKAQDDEVARLQKEVEKAREAAKDAAEQEKQANAALSKEIAHSEAMATKHQSHVSEMKNELKVKDPVIENKNTSMLDGEFNKKPTLSTGDSDSSGVEEEEETFEFTMKLKGTSNSGLKDDFITNVKSPVLVGTGTPDSTVTVTIDGTIIGKIKVTSSGEWEMPLTEFAEGSFDISAKDTAGRSCSATLVIDTTNTLSVSFDSDSNIVGDNITNEKVLTFSGTSDAGATIEVSVANHKYTTVVKDDGSWSVECSDAVPDGSWSVSIKSTDIAGNIKKESVDIQVDTEAVGTLVLDKSCDSGVSDSDLITNVSNNLKFSGVVEEGATAVFLFDGVEYPLTVSNGHWNVVVNKALSDGQHECSLKISDVAGNTREIVKEITVDTVNKFSGGLSDSSDTGESNSDGITKDNTPVFSGSGEPESKVVLNIANKTFYTTVKSDGTWSIKIPSPLNDSDYKYTIESTDIAGNKAVEQGKVTIDSGIIMSMKLLNDSEIDGDGITNNSELKIGGVIEVNGDIRIYSKSIPEINGKRLDVSEDGTFNYTFPKLPDGEYSFSIVGTDQAGNEKTIEKTVVVDTKTFVESSLSSSSDSGVSDQDLITGDVPVFVGKGEAGATVTILLNNKEYTAIVAKDGHWSLPISDNLKDGTYVVQTKIKDIAGNEAQSPDLKLVIDKTNPEHQQIVLGNDSGESKSDWLTNNGALELSGKIEAGCELTIIIDGRDTYTQSNGLVVGKDGTWTLSLSEPLPDGNHRVVATIVDIAGNETVDKAELIVDSSISVSGGLSQASDSGVSDSDGYTNVTKLVFAGATDSDKEVFVTFDGVKYDAKLNTSTGLWEAEVTCEKSGSYNYSITAIDKAGNEKTTNTEIVTIDLEKPSTISLKMDTDSGESGSDFITNINRIGFSGGYEAGCALELIVTDKDGVKSFFRSPTDIVVNANGTWSFQSSSKLADGEYNVVLKETDKAGNVSEISKDITIDTKISLSERLSASSDTGFNNSDRITNQLKPEISGVSDPLNKIRVNIDGQEYTTVVNKDGSWSIPVDHELTCGDGHVKYTVTAEDVAGNVVSKNDYIVLDTQNSVSVQLTESSNTGSKTDFITQYAKSFSGMSEPLSQITVAINSQVYRTVADASGKWVCPIDDVLPDGTYKVTVRSCDVAGNIASQEHSVIVDSQNSVSAALAAVSDTGISHSDGQTSSNKPQIDGVSDPNSSITVVIKGVEYKTTSDDKGKWSVTVQNELSDGVVQGDVFSEDIAGNKANGHFNFTVDTHNFIDVALASGFDTGVDSTDHITSSKQPELTGRTDPNSDVVVHVGTDEYHVKAGEDGVWVLNGIKTLADGSYKVRAVSVDVAGNEAQLSDSYVLVIDSKSPTYGGTKLKNDTGSSSSDFITNDGSIALTGQCEDSSIQVTVKINGSVLSSPNDINVSPDGNWEMVSPIKLGETKDLPIVIEYTDVAGNVSKETKYLNVDTSNKVDIGVDAASDTGISGDAITKNSNIEMSGKTDPHCHVTVVVAGHSYEAVSDSDGVYSVKLSGVHEGVHQVDVTSVDLAGNKSEYTTIVTVDQTGIALGNIRLNTDSGVKGDWITNTAKPEFSGIAEHDANLKVSIKGDGGDITLVSGKDFKISVDGSWSVNLDSEDLSDGSYAVTINSVDRAGNESAITKSLVIDSKNTLAVRVDEESDTGSSHTDSLTNKKEITVVGTTDPNSKVTVSVGGHDYKTTSNKDGVWSIDVQSPLNEGKNTVTVTSVDVANNEITKEITVVLDTISPSESKIILETDSGVLLDNKTNSKILTWSGVVDSGSSVEFLLNGVKCDGVEVTQDGHWHVSADASALNGLNQCSLVVTDAAGNSRVIDTNVNIDRHNDVTCALDTASDTGLSHTDGIISISTPTLMGKTDPKAKVTLVVEGHEYTSQADEHGNWKIDIRTPLENGKNDYTVTSEDDAGNIVSKSGFFTVDLVKPTVNIKLMNDSGADHHDWLSRENKPILSGEIEDGANIVVKVDDAVYDKNLITIVDGTWQLVTPVPLDDGSHKISVSITDVAGNISKSDKTLLIDTNSEIKQILLDSASDSGVKDGHLTNVNKPKFCGVSEPNSEIQVQVAGNSYTTKANKDGSWEVTVSNAIPDGEYDWVVKSVDLAGNQATKTDKITIDTKCELVVGFSDGSDTGISKSDGITKNTDPTLVGHVSEDCDKVVVDVDGHKTVVDVSGGDFTFTPTESLDDGKHHVKVIATESAFGNTVSFEKDITVDTKSPIVDKPTLVGDTGASATDGITKQDNIEFSGTMAKGDSVVITVAGRQYTVDNGVKLTEKPDGTVEWDIVVPTYQGDSVCKYSVSVSDIAGNVGEYSNEIVIDRHNKLFASEVDNDGDKEDHTIKSSHPDFVGTSDPKSEIKLVIANREFNTVTDEKGNWSIKTDTLDLKDGSYHYTVESTDIAGNVAKVDKTLTIDSETSITGGLSESDDTGLSDHDGITKLTNLTLQGDGERGAGLVITVAKKEYHATVDQLGHWKFEIPQKLSDGGYDYTVVSTDRTGNTASLVGHIVVDTNNFLTSALSADSDTSGADGTDKDYYTSVKRPRWEGTTSEGSVVTIIINGGEYEVPVERDGSWKFEPPFDLNEGANAVVVKSVDVAGNLVTDSNSVVIDTTTEINETGLDSSSDTGLVHNDNITCNNKPTISGRGEVGAQVTVTINHKEYTTTVGKDGVWRVDVTDPLADGKYDYVAKITDRAGNTSEKNASLEIDTTMGTTEAGLSSDSDTGANNNDRLINTTTPKIVGIGEAKSAVEVVIDGKSYKSFVDGDGNWSVAIDNPLDKDGEHKYTVKFTDVAGNTRTLDGDLTLDTKIVLTGAISKKSDSGESDSDAYTSVSHPEISGNVDEGSVVKVFVDGSKDPINAVVNKDGSWSCRIDENLVDGEHTYSIVAVDQAGNSTEIKDRSFVLDRTAHVSSELSAATDSNLKDGVTNAQTPVLQGVAEKDAHVIVSISGAAGVEKLTAEVAKDGTWKLSVPTTYKDGTYNIDVQETDKAGNKDSSQMVLVIDRHINLTYDLISDSGIDAATKKDGRTNAKNLIIGGTGEPDASIDVELGGSHYRTTVARNGSWRVEIGDQELADGVVHYDVTTKDLAGNSIENQAGTIIIDRTTDLTIGLVNDSANPKDNITKNKDLEFGGTGEAGGIVTVTINNQSYTANVGENGKWSLHVNGMDDGHYDVEASITDKAGNIKSLQPFNVTVDTSTAVDISLDSGSDTGRSNSDGQTFNSHPTFMGHYEAGSSLVVSIDGGKTYTLSDKELRIVGENQWVLVVSDALDEGEHVVSVTSTDEAGNIAKDEYSINVDLHKPTSTITFVDGTSSVNPELTSHRQPSFTASSENDAIVRVYLDGVSTGNPIKVENGAWRFMQPSKLDDGVHHYKFVIEDVAGNQETLEKTVIVDTETSVTAHLSSSQDHGTSTSDNITNTKSGIIIDGTGEAGSSIKLVVDGMEHTTTVDPNGTWEINVGALSGFDCNGVEHRYKVTATDEAGNVKSYESSVTVDNINPTLINLTLVGDSGESSTDWKTNSKGIVIKGDTRDGGITTIYVDGIAVKSGVSGEWTCDLGNRKDGTYKVKIETTDVAGNVISDEKELVVRREVALSGGITTDGDSGVSHTDGVTKFHRPPFGGDASPFAKITLVVTDSEGVKTTMHTTADKNGKWEIGSSEFSGSLHEGIYNYVIEANDEFGNTASIKDKLIIDSSESVSVGLSSASNTGLVDADNMCNRDKPQLTGNVGSSDDSVDIDVKNEDGTTVQHLVGRVSESGEWVADVANGLADGVYTATATARDKAGNIATKDLTFTIDTHKPERLDYSLSHGTDSGQVDDLLTKNRKPVLVGHVEVGCTVEIGLNGVTYKAKVSADGSWECPITQELDDGSYPFDIVVRDRANNKLVKSDSVVIDNKNFISTELAENADTGSSSTDGITKNNHFDIVGKTDPFSKVVISAQIDGSNKEISVEVGEDGKFQTGVGQLTDSGVLADGEYDIYITSVDPAGNKATSKEHVVVDTAKPFDVTIALDKDSNSANKSDLITNIKAPVVHGNAEYGCHAVVKVDGSKTIPVDVNEDNKWELALPELSDGSHNVEIIVTDKAGNISKSKETIVIDTEIPLNETIHFGLSASSETGRWIDGVTSKNSNITLSGSCEAGCTLKIDVDGKTFTTPVRSDGKWDLLLPDTYADGTHIVKLTVTDEAGNVNSSSRGRFIVDTIKPVVNDFSMTDDTDTNKVGDQITNNQSPSFFGHGGKDIAYVRMIIDGVDEKFVGTVNSDGTFKVDTSDLSDGTYTYHFVVEDRAGNVTKTSNKSFTVDHFITVDGSLAESSDSGSSNSDNITNCLTPSIEINTNAGNKVTLHITAPDGNVIFNETKRIDTATYQWDLDGVSDLSDGVYKCKMTARDEAGNVKTKVVAFTVDSVSNVSGVLSVASDSGAKGDSLTNAKLPVFSGDSENGSTITLKIFGKFDDGFYGNRTYKTTADARGNWTIPVTNELSDGDVKYEITAIDKAGNESMVGIGNSGTIHIDATPPVLSNAFMITDSGVDSLDGITHGYNDGVNKGHVAFSGSTSGDAKTIVVTLNTGQSFKANVGSDGSWNLVIKDSIPDHSYTATIAAYDAAGNKSATIEKKFVYDTKVVAMLDLSSSSSEDTGEVGDGRTRNPKPKIVGRCEDGLEVVSASLKGIGVDIAIDNIVVNNGEFTIDLAKFVSGAGLKDGDYHVDLELSDKAGNTAEKSYQFTIDLIPPSINLSHRYNDETVVSGVPVIKGTTEADCTVILNIGGKNIWIKSESDGTFEFDPNKFPHLGDGSIDYTVSAVDKAGNVGKTKDSFVMDSGTAVTGGLNGSDDTGVLFTDNYTQVNKPHFSGSGEVGATVTVKIYHTDGKLAVEKSVAVDADGTWALQFTDAIPDGHYKYDIIGEDLSHNTAHLERQVPLVIDNKLVVSSITAISSWNECTGTTYDGQRYLGRNTGTFKGLLADHEFGAEIKITVGDKVFEGFSDSKGTFNVAWELPDGHYVANVVITDKAGNSHNTQIIMNVDGKVKEDFTINCENNLNKDIADIRIHDRNIKLSGKCDVDDHTTIILNLYGSHRLTYHAKVANGHWVIDEPIPDGLYSFDYTYREKSGAYIWRRGQLSVDTVNEILKVVGFEKVTDDTGHWVSTTMKGFGEVGATISVEVAGKKYSTVVKDGGNWSIDVDINKNEVFDAKVVSTDKSENVRVWDDGDADKEHNKIALDLFDGVESNLVDHGSYKNGSLCGNAPAGARVHAVFTNSLDHNDVVTVYAITDSHGKWVLDTAGVKDGNWNVSLNVSSTWSSHTKEFSLVMDNVAPDVVVGEIENSNGDFVSTKAFILSGKAEPNTTIDIHIAGKVEKVSVGSDGRWSLDQNLENGTYKYFIECQDKAGNKSVSKETTFVVDDVKPNTSVAIENITDIDGKTYTASKHLTVSGKIETAHIDHIEVNVDDVKYVSGKDFAVAKDGTWKFVSPVLEDESILPVDVTAFGKNGLEQRCEKATVRTDFTSPDIEVTSPEVTTSVAQLPELHGTVSKDTASVHVIVDGVSHDAVLNGKNWSYAPTKLPSGNHSYHIEAIDHLGNKSTHDCGVVHIDVTEAPHEQHAPISLFAEGHVEDSLVDLHEDQVHGLVALKVDANVDCELIEVYADGKILTSVNRGEDISLKMDDISGKELNVIGVDTMGGERTLAKIHEDFSKDNAIESMTKLSGVADSNSEVSIHADGQEIHKVVADEHGNWNADISSNVDLLGVSVTEKHAGIDTTSKLADSGHHTDHSVAVSNHHEGSIFTTTHDDYEDYNNYI